MAERNAYKDSIAQMKRKGDEENFDEAAGQAYRSFIETTVPGEVARLFDDPKLQALDAMCKAFALKYVVITHISFRKLRRSTTSSQLSKNSPRNHLTRCL